MSKLIDSAVGYFQLGMFQEANEEIEALPPEMKVCPEVLRLRVSIYLELEAWELMREVARFLAESFPNDSQHWIWWAYATRRADSIEKAEGILLSALGYHPDEAMIRFNLACYSSQQGRIDEAKERLSEAIQLDPGCRMMALDDPDLKPLWDSMSV